MPIKETEMVTSLNMSRELPRLRRRSQAWRICMPISGNFYRGRHKRQTHRPVLNVAAPPSISTIMMYRTTCKFVKQCK
jgi:hypothetical protein